MSHVATAWAYRQNIDAGPKFVLVALADFADEKGTCFPGQERLADMTGMHRSSVVRHIKTLEKLGLLTRTRRGRPDGRGRSSDRYQLNLTTNVAPSNVADSNVATNNVANDDDQCRNLHGSMSQSATGTVREPSENRQKEPRTRGTRITDDFQPNQANLEWAATDAPDVDLQRETAALIDHFASLPGQKGIKTDWQRTWRNWIRRQQGWINDRNGGRPSTKAREEAEDLWTRLREQSA